MRRFVSDQLSGVQLVQAVLSGGFVECTSFAHQSFPERLPAISWLPARFLYQAVLYGVVPVCHGLLRNAD
jgi:hypothetical protein